ncbi:MAG: hypothetical protein WDN66_04965 [Candidatus Saccharibacteria bacterium]
MVPVDYTNFFVAVLTASASFIGLLFVAMTLIVDKSSKSRKQIVKENISAEASYIALLNLFFVALVALTPQAQLNYVMAIMGVLGILSSVRLFRSGLRNGASRGILGISTVIYVLEIVYGVYLIFNSNKTISETLLLIIVFTLFGSALGRAWELTGIHDEHDKT